MCFGSKEIIVMTGKNVKIGKIRRKRICSTGCVVEISDSQDHFIYGIKV
jgi:hypothetical protein